MKVERQRIVIAEIRGWKNIEWYEDNAGPPLLTGKPPPNYKKRHANDSLVPDYSTSQDAFEEALGTLNMGNQKQCGSARRYEKELATIIKRDRSIFGPALASLKQKTEAFIRAWDRWEEIRKPRTALEVLANLVAACGSIPSDVSTPSQWDEAYADARAFLDSENARGDGSPDEKSQPAK